MIHMDEVEEVPSPSASTVPLRALDQGVSSEFLDEDLVEQVIRYLSPKGIMKVSHVCKSWHRITYKSELAPLWSDEGLGIVKWLSSGSGRELFWQRRMWEAVWVKGKNETFLQDDIPANIDCYVLSEPEYAKTCAVPLCYAGPQIIPFVWFDGYGSPNTDDDFLSACDDLSPFPWMKTSPDWNDITKIVYWPRCTTLHISTDVHPDLYRRESEEEMEENLELERPAAVESNVLLLPFPVNDTQGLNKSIERIRNVLSNPLYKDLPCAIVVAVCGNGEKPTDGFLIEMKEILQRAKCNIIRAYCVCSLYSVEDIALLYYAVLQSVLWEKGKRLLGHMEQHSRKEGFIEKVKNSCFSCWKRKK